MSTQQAVIELAALGSLPSEEEATVEGLQKFEQLISLVHKPVSDEDASMLVKILGPDDCYGGAWTLVHLIESAPGWPIPEALAVAHHAWRQELCERVERGRDRTSQPY